MTECPECKLELEKIYKEHWSGNTTWFQCPRCLIEILYDLELCN